MIFSKKAQFLSHSRYLLFFVSMFFVQAAFGQFSIPAKPKVQTSVYDYTKILSASQKQALETKLVQYSDTTSTQIVVAIIDSTNGESIGILAPKWGQEWGVGQAKEDNGVFILLALKDREIWIAPGYGVEHLLTAGITGELTRNVIIPEFKNGDYYSGLDKGADAIFSVLKGTYKGSRKGSNNSDTPTFFKLIPIIFFIILFIILSNKNNRGGRGGTKRNIAGTLLDVLILSSAGRGFGGGSSGGFGGGSSGGFGGGFGGGGFSGGGAGGSW
ncbi:methanol dehydrogenase [Polaribacter pacificus]|uniref:Methanol dehydrogenase n=1 Tax=Polaribacter pacificus TaxID=1775173 RepID=A0A917HUS3_9FLAO|nr:TPM domain-containing protein [Polaribacter pacificus]GGG91065.1 methanol dehydrogenase [Polaribacter pacificus]